MAACDMIRQCSSQVGNLWNQLNSTSDQGKRRAIGRQITTHISQCVAAMGRPNKVTGDDTIHFGPPYNVTYDVIQNMNSGTAQVSCHKIFDSGSPGSDVTGSPGTGVSYDPGTGSSLLSGVSGFSIMGLGTIPSILIILIGIIILVKIIKMLK